MNIRVARPITSEEWKNWNSYQRYALYKTAISRSEPEAFFAVLDELRGGESQPIKTHD